MRKVIRLKKANVNAAVVLQARFASWRSKEEVDVDDKDKQREGDRKHQTDTESFQ